LALRAQARSKGGHGRRQRRGERRGHATRRTEHVATAPTLLVPATVEELLDRDWLAAHLDDIEDGDEIVRVERTDSTRTRGEKLRFAVTVRQADGLHVRYYCAKAHLDGTPSTGVISEARFYRDLAPRIDVRVPRVPYVAIDGTEGAIIVMEDVVAN